MNQKVSVLILHSSVSHQIEKLAGEMKDEFIQQGHDVHFTDDISGLSETELGAFDLVCIGTEKGKQGYAHATRLFAHPQLAVFSNSRRSLFSLRKAADKENARISDLALFPVQKGLFYPFRAWTNYRKYGNSNPGFEGFNMYPYGVPDEELGRARDFAKNLCRQMSIQQESKLVYS